MLAMNDAQPPIVARGRSELHQAFAEIVEALIRSQAPPPDAAAVCRRITAHRRVSADQLPGSLAQAIADMDAGGRPGNYSQAARRTLPLLGD
jgi:hypothetical protein